MCTAAGLCIGSVLLRGCLFGACTVLCMARSRALSRGEVASDVSGVLLHHACGQAAAARVDEVMWGHRRVGGTTKPIPSQDGQEG